MVPRWGTAVLRIAFLLMNNVVPRWGTAVLRPALNI